MEQIEREALDMGWTPQEHFKGDPEKWVDAETFVRRGKEFIPFLRKTNERLTTEVGGLKAQIAEMSKAVAEANEAMTTFKEYHEETEKRAYEKAIDDLNAQKEAALEAGDHKTVVAIDNSLRELDRKAPGDLKQSAPPAPAPAPASALPSPPPEFVQWEADNQSWLKDERKQAYAMAIGPKLRRENPTVTGRPFLDLITAEVEATFGSTPTSRVEGGRSGSGGRGPAHSFENLPPEAKAACDRMGAKLVGPNRAFKDMDSWRKDYVKNYAWD